MIGTDSYSSEQWSILSNLVREKIIEYPGVKVIGHNEISEKTCPGFNVQEWLINNEIIRN